jgi:diguanylate cyclase (GGDEF)-like protein
VLSTDRLIAPLRALRLKLPLPLQDVRLRMRVVYVVILALGVVFSVLVLAYSDQILNASRRLVRADLPALSQIAAIKLEVVRQEAALYDYYATGDRERFRREHDAREQTIRSLLRLLAQTPAGQARTQGLQASYARLDALTDDLDAVLAQTPVDWPRAHKGLLRVGSLVRDFNAELDVLADLVQAQVMQSADLTESTVLRMGRLAILFSMGVFLIAVLVGYYIKAYFQESVERRRLAVFAERNPNAVMRLSLAGEIVYANPAAHELARRMGAETPRVLLPADLAVRLRELKGSPQRYEVWRYEREGRTIECGVHFLPDLASFHAYVADVTERRLAEEKLAYHAYHHPLTGLPNRRMFQEVVEQTLVMPEHGGLRAGVFLLGLDRFKVVIDTLGHDIGDQLLKGVATRWKSVLGREAGRGATLYHFGGDLFAVLAPGLTGEQGPVLTAEKLLGALSRPLYVAGREFFVSASIGVAVFPEDGDDAITLLRKADAALNRVKRHGGRGFQLYKPEMNALAERWMALENYLRHAIEYGELRLHYQPQIDLRTGRVTGLEALLRWAHPQRGLLGPGEFISLAEESGMISQIGEWALREACTDARRWRERGLLNAPVAVNVSGRQFRADLPALVRSVLDETGLPAEALEIEITESIAMQDVEGTVAMLDRLKAMGVRIAIDDFGTGFSSLAYLKRFPLDKLKLDQSFMRHLTTDETDAAIARTVATLGHALRLRVLAEGVETGEQRTRLLSLEYDEAQGALYGLPMSTEQIEAWISRGKRLALS